jgi:hypothetical protein
MPSSTASPRVNPYASPVSTRPEKDSHVVVEWSLASNVKTVSLVPLFTTLINRAATTGRMTFFDTGGDEFCVEQLPRLSSEKFCEQFKVESVKARDGSRVLLGFTFRSSASLEEVKRAISYEWLRRNNIYIRLHPLGFDNGLDMHLIGYFTHVHPRFACLFSLREEIKLDWHRAHMALSMSTDPTTTQQLRKAYEGKSLLEADHDSIQIPLSLEKSVMPGVDTQGKKFSTPALTLRVPKQFTSIATLLMDFCVLDENPIKNFVPYGLRKEDPETFDKLARSQAKWMDDHRNISITNVTARVFSAPVPGIQDGSTSLRTCLRDKHGVLGVHYHVLEEYVNISVDKSGYEEMNCWIDQLLTGYHDTTTDKHPARRPSNRPSSAINKGVGGRYSARTFQIDDEAATYNPQPKANAWSRGPPVTILINTSSDQSDFPDLPNDKPTIADSVTKADDTFTLDDQTVRTIIAEEIHKFTSEQERRAQQMQDQFQSELQRMETQFQQVAAATLKSSLAEFSSATTQQLNQFNTETTTRFTTQTDFNALAQSVKDITDAVNYLVNTMKGNKSTGETSAPSPPRKLTRISDQIQVTPSSPGRAYRNHDAEMAEAGEQT